MRAKEGAEQKVVEVEEGQDEGVRVRRVQMPGRGMWGEMEG